MTGTLVAPNPSYGASVTSTNSICNGLANLPQTSLALLCTGYRPPEVRELARALKNDPNLIYEYVRNSVDTEFQFGLQKGAMGIIIDGSGTAFDQAELMVELLREAGTNTEQNFNPVYQYGTITLTGTTFFNWTGITDATAACKFLATGGIPATITASGSTANSDCSGVSGALTSVVMQHVWVQVTINGTNYLFDPSYKPYTHKFGMTPTAAGMVTTNGTTINVTQGMSVSAAMNYSAASALNAATSGMTSNTSTVAVNATSSSPGTQTSAPYVANLSATGSGGLNSTLQSYATTMLGVLKAACQGCDMSDVVGGRVIQPLGARPVGGWRQASLNQTGITYTLAATWPQNGWASVPTNVTGIPDQFRTTLEVNASISTTYGPFFDQVFFVDEIYGRRLMLQSMQTGYGGGSSVPYAPAGASNYPRYAYYPQITLDGVVIGTSQYGNDLDGAWTFLTLTPKHPFAAASTGAFNYDVPVSKLVDPLYPALIVHGWGHTSEGLAAKWQTESGNDSIQPRMWYEPNPDNPSDYFPQQSGDLQRSNIGAAWLAQMSQASELHAEIAGSRFQHLHTLGVVATEQNVTVPYIGGQVQICSSSGQPAHICNTPQLAGIQPVDQLGYLDVETSFGLTSRSSNVVQRRAAVHAIAATDAALEGSVFEQLTDNPDASSTARRFAWGNAPEAGETPATTSRPAYLFNLAAQGASPTISPNFFLVESKATDNTQPTGFLNNWGGWGAWGGEVEPVPTSAVTGATSAISRGVNQYLSSAFCGSSTNCEVVASQEAMLGPGFRNGSTWVNSFTSSQAGNLTTGSDLDIVNPNQVGGALIANQYDANNNPLQIAHIVFNQYMLHKGGGGGMTDAVNFNAQALQNSLKDRFVDRSTELGVDLKSGVASFASPVLSSVGSGEFPYKLDAHLELKGGGLKEFPLYPNTDGNISSWVHNWMGSADPSNSGAEAMGKSRVEASAGTLAAFVAMQDIWSSAQGVSREVSGELAADWWGRQLTFNVVTLSLGSKNQEFVRLIDGSYIPAAGGGDKLAVASGFTRTAVRPYTSAITSSGSNLYPISSRQWRYQQSGASSFTWTGINGDVRQYAYWEGNLTSGNQQVQTSASDASSTPSGYTFWDSGAAYPQTNTGFRLSTWTFPYGVALTLNYSSTAVAASQNLPAYSATSAYPISVTSSLGRTLNLPSAGQNGCTAAQSLTATNLANETTTASFLGPQALSETVRPVASCPLSAVYEPVNASQPAIQYGYDSLGRVMQAQDAVSVQQGTAVRAPYTYYIAPGYRGEWDDPLGGQYAVESLLGGREARTIDELGRQTIAVTDGRHRTLVRAFPEGDQEQFGYNAYDQVTWLTKVAKPGSPLAPISVTATYDPVWNKLASITDALSNTTNLSYYGAGVSGASELQQAQRPAIGGTRPTYTYQYNAAGLVTQEVDPTGVTTTHGYDSYGDLTQTTQGAAAALASGAVNLTTTFFYDTASGPGVGNVLTIKDPRATLNSSTDPHGQVTTIQYDAMRRKTDTQLRDLTATATPMARSHWVYDLNGRVTQEQHASALDGSGNATAWATTTTAYTPTSQKAQVTDPLGNIIQMSYDGDDHLLCSAIRMNPAVYGSLPDACTLSTPSSPTTPDRITKFAYDAAGEKVSETRAYGIVTPTYPTTLQMAYATYAYNPNGTVQKVWDANNNLTTYIYDGFDRLAQTQFPSKTRYATQASAASDTADVESYSYDANGNRLSLTKRDGVHVINWCYDALNRAVDKYVNQTAAITTSQCATPPALQTSATNGNDVQTNYDLAGRKNWASYLGGNGVVYQYDSAGRPMTETTAGWTVTYGMDPSSNMTRMTWPDGYFAQYWYDGLNRLISVDENNATYNGNVIASYAYDPLSRRTGASGADGSSTAYGYDAASHITSLAHTLPNSAFNVTFGPFTYNPAHQILSRPSSNTAYDFTSYANGTDWTSTSNGLNQDATIAALSGGYDGNGNEGNDGTRTFTYDVENRLITASIPSASTNATLSYDPTGRLTQDQATISGTVTTTNFVYAGDKLVAEYVGGAVSQRYVHGAGTDEPILWYQGSSVANRNWLHTDNQGSVIATSTTSAVTAYQYGAYGEPNAWSGERFRYTGQIMLPELKLYYYKARVYDPIAGRFLQTDPVGYKDNFSLYEYVGDDPVNKTDPKGEVALVHVDGNNVQITLQVSFTGSGDNKKTEQKIVNAIQKAWSGKFGKYNVVTKVEVMSTKDTKTTNVINISSSVTRSNVVGAGTVANVNPNDSSNVIAHEAGHLMGSDDHYWESTYKGQAVTWPVSGWRGNIMAETTDKEGNPRKNGGGVVEQKNIDEVLNPTGAAGYNVKN